MAHRVAVAAAVVAVCAFPAPAGAAGGSYAIDGGTRAQQAQVRGALDATAFDWSLIPARIQIHVVRGLGVSHATKGHVWLDAALLDTGRFAWATVQDEFAHQIDYFLLDDAKRVRLNGALGGRDWCYGVAGLAHGDYGCERFTSTLVWSYWQSPHNAYRPQSARDESAAMAPARFRALLAEVLGRPTVAAGRSVSSKRRP